MLEELVVRRRAMGLKRLVIADSPADIALWGWSFKKLLEPFPKSVKEVIGKGEAADQKAWWDAMMVFYAQHGCRNQPFPQESHHVRVLVRTELRSDCRKFGVSRQCSRTTRNCIHLFDALYVAA